MNEIRGSEVVELVMLAVFKAMAGDITRADREPDMHWHLCWTCKTPWEHARPINVSSEEYEEAHMCPSCGAGPWNTRHDSEQEARQRLASGPTFGDRLDPAFGSKRRK